MSNSSVTPPIIPADEKVKMTTDLRKFRYPLRIFINKVPTSCFAGYTNFHDTLPEDLCFKQSTGQRTDASYGKLIYERVHIYDWLVSSFGPLTAEAALNCLTIGEPDSKERLCHEGKTLKELVDAGNCSDAGKTMREVLCQGHTRRVDPGTLFETKESDAISHYVFRLGANGLFTYGPFYLDSNLPKCVYDWLTAMQFKDCPTSEGECHAFFYCVKTGKSLRDIELALEE